MRRMANDFNMSEATVKRIIKKNIGARSLARTKNLLLNDYLKTLRLQRSKKLLHVEEKSANFVAPRRKILLIQPAIVELTISPPRRMPRKSLMPSDQSKCLSILHRLWFSDSLTLSKKICCLSFLRQI